MMDIMIFDNKDGTYTVKGPSLEVTNTDLSKALEEYYERANHTDKFNI